MLPDPRTTPTISVDEAAAILGLSRTRVYVMCSEGTCPSVPGLGIRVRIPTEAFLAKFELAGAQ